MIVEYDEITKLIHIEVDEGMFLNIPEAKDLAYRLNILITKLEAKENEAILIGARSTC